MFYALVIFVHIIVCLILIFVILLQAGRGSGLGETFGLDSSRTIFGTKMSVFLTKSTVVAAGLFLVTSLLLGILTSLRGKSLIDIKRISPPAANRGAIPENIPIAKPEELPKK